MTQVSYPGVYIEEIPSGVRTITGVSTSVTAFIGYTRKGPVNKASRIFDFGSYEREFGGLAKDSELGYAVQQFFLNGGSEAWIVRVAAGAKKASLTLKNAGEGSVGSKKTLTVEARSEGYWGNLLRIDVDFDTTNPDSSFNLMVTEYIKDGTDLLLNRSETHRNLTMDQNSSHYAPNVINTASELITAKRHADAELALSSLDEGWSMSGDLDGLTLPADLDDTKRFISIIVDGDGPHEVPIFATGAPPSSMNDLRDALQSAIRGINPGLNRFSAFTVTRVNALGATSATGDFLLFTSGTPATDAREGSAVQILDASSNSASKVLKLGLANGGRERIAAADLRPNQTGTVSEDLADKSAADLSAIASGDQIRMRVEDGSTVIAQQNFTFGADISTVTSLADLADLMQKRIRAIDPNQPAFSKATVEAIGTRLRVVAGTDKTDATVEFSNQSGGTAATTLRINTVSTSENVQRYSVGVGVDRADQVDADPGADGTPPNATLLKGKLAEKTGIYALEDVDIFNIMCIPRMAELGETDALSLVGEAVEYCADKRAFLIIDPPKSKDQVKEIEDWATKKITPHKNAAMYYPFVKIADPLDNFRLNAFPPSGTIAGLYARTDASRGVWKAPAGTEATLANVQGLAYTLTDMENGVLNKIAVNCLRQFPVYGRVSWGARTTDGADQKGSEWKYIPIRRLALYIEESLFRGTQWVVFEPNDAPLWAQIRLNVGAFMHNLFRQGAFQGQTPREAYFVKCDKETTTQNDINRGIVNILVGFAPLKPAEFVVIKIQQIAGDIET